MRLLKTTFGYIINLDNISDFRLEITAGEHTVSAYSVTGGMCTGLGHVSDQQEFLDVMTEIKANAFTTIPTFDSFVERVRASKQVPAY